MGIEGQNKRLEERAEQERAKVRKLNPKTPSGDTLWQPSALDRFTYDELTDDPDPVPFVIHPYLPAGCAAVLTAAGGTNKTGFMALQAVHVCTGQDLFGSKVMQGQVLYVSAEDRRDQLRRHVWAHTRDLPPFMRQRVADNFIVKDAVGLGFKLTRHIEGQTVIAAADIEGLVQFARTLPALRLVILDTLSRLNGGTEENDDMSRIIEAMEAIGRATGAATEVSHHTGKGQMRQGVVDQYSGRGASSLSDNARSVMHLHRLTPSDAGSPSNGADLIGKGRLLRLSHVKANYAAKAPDRYLQIQPTPHAANLSTFSPEYGAGAIASVWARLCDWLAQGEVEYPNKSTFENSLGEEYGSRAQRRDAVEWAMDRGLLVELPHPNPQGRRKTYLALPSQQVAA